MLLNKKLKGYPSIRRNLSLSRLFFGANSLSINRKCFDTNHPLQVINSGRLPVFECSFQNSYRILKRHKENLFQLLSKWALSGENDRCVICVLDCSNQLSDFSFLKVGFEPTTSTGDFKCQNRINETCSTSVLYRNTRQGRLKTSRSFNLIQSWSKTMRYICVIEKFCKNFKYS